MNTYSDIYLHIVFSVKYRDALIGKYLLHDLHAYIASIFNAKGHQTIIVGGTADHVHALIRYNVNQSVPDMVRDVKMASSTWINAAHRCMYRFAWQKGYGVFSYSESQVATIRNYIANQEQHHQNVNSVDEFVNILNTRHIKYDSAYLPQPPA
jgi:REP element-mobilizing transposase RayT